ncbi:MAG: OmpA family protein [Lutibacter sp.]|uniref:OmpA family protein n=1 Tax=Lutibacter sp. TaxID=1925666 RepID=UPI0038591EC2
MYTEFGVLKSKDKCNVTSLYKFTIDCDSSYKIVGSQKNYKDDSREFVSESSVNLELDLQKKSNDFVKVRGKVMVNINPIYFDYNKSNIRKNAAIELDKVVKIMNKYPSVKIEGGSHTDSRGNSSYNQKLSAKRANATIKYNISKGINENRLIAKWFGETQLVNKCANGVKCTDAEHQLNRTTEFIIVNTGVVNQ